MKGLKKVICLIATLTIVAGAFAGCGKTEEAKNEPTKYVEKKPADYKGEITFWHFNKDEGPAMVEMFNKTYPNIKVNLQIVPDKDQAYQNKITQALANGGEVPDVYCGESAFVKRFVNIEDGFADLSQAPFNAGEITKNMVAATVDIGRDNSGKIKALTYQVTPGGIGYKRGLAKQYFGTDDPEKISEMMSTPEKILEMARALKEKSAGKATFFACRQELERVYFGARADGWVKDGKLVVDPMVDKYVDMAKIFRSEGLEAGLEQWAQPWAASIAGNTSLAYAVPTWGIPWIVESNDPKRKDKGEWAIAKSPIAYSWGGTWLGVYSKSKNKELAWQFVKFLTSNKDQMKAWGSAHGDFMNNTELINELATSGENNKTFNQNPYAVFKPSLDGINGKILTEYDDRITAAFDDNMATYLSGKISKDDMYKKFKDKVKSDFPDLKVE